MCRPSILNVTEKSQEIKKEAGKVYLSSAVKKGPYFFSFHKNITT
jgi:hypothetical protein